MIRWRMQIDMKATVDTPTETLYRVGLEQAAWADDRGLTEVWVDEHHGSQNLPSPFVVAAGVAAMTRRVRIAVGCLLLPLLDPVRAAEDTLVVDAISEGRVEIVVGLGYVPHEFEMFGQRLEDRAAMVEEKLPVYLTCLTGEPFEYGARVGRVMPRPYQKPRPPVLVGGSVAASARRAARLGDGFAPAVADEELVALYRSECERRGRPPGPVLLPNYPLFVHVTEDPERAWARLGPYIRDELNQYGSWSAQADEPRIGYAALAEPIEQLAALRQMPQWAIVTPDECVELGRRLPDDAKLSFKPLRSGLETNLGWESLELFVAKVLPHLDVAPPRPAAPVHVEARA